MPFKPIEYHEYNEINVDTVKKTYSDLINVITHSPGCIDPSCLFQRYKEKYKNKGRKFDEESFFLRWLTGEIRFSSVKGKWNLIYKNESEREPNESPTTQIFRSSLIEYFRVPRIYKKTSEFIKKYLSNNNINSNPQRIKLKVWRLKKSGIIGDLEFEILKEWSKIQPSEKKETWKKTREDFKFAQNVANYIYSLPEKQIKRRSLLRKGRFQGKTVEDLKRIHDHLNFNFRIDNKKEGYRNKTTVYYSTTKSSRGRYWSVGYTVTRK